MAGKAIFQGKDLLKLTEEELRHVRGAQISMVFQDPMTFFNPVIPIGQAGGRTTGNPSGIIQKRCRSAGR